MNFTDTEYVIFRGLIIFEFACTVVSLMVVLMTFYLVASVPQFHVNLIAIIANMPIAYIIIAGGRIIEIIYVLFDPHIGK